MIDPTKPFDVNAVVARYNKLVFGLCQLAKQKLYEELDEDEREYADFEMGYAQMVKVSRALLADCQESEKIVN